MLLRFTSLHHQLTNGKLDDAALKKIEAGDKPGTQKVTLVSKEPGVTKEAAVKSLGKQATRYVVVTWTDPTAPADEADEEKEEEAAKG